MSNTSILSISLLILGSIALPDAARSAAISISYHQVGICKGYDTAAGPVTTRSDEAFAKSKPWTIQNPAEVSISTQRIFMWTNPLLNKMRRRLCGTRRAITESW
jgi:hypothetical protein